jgi:hypothetical protein
MLTWPPTIRIFVSTQSTDMRRSFNGLAMTTRESMGQDPRRGICSSSSTAGMMRQNHVLGSFGILQIDDLQNQLDWFKRHVFDRRSDIMFTRMRSNYSPLRSYYYSLWRAFNGKKSTHNRHYRTGWKLSV